MAVALAYGQGVFDDEEPAAKVQSAEHGASGKRSSPLSGSLQGIIADDDYPAAALERNEQGSTSVSLDIDRRGRVAKCAVTQSSGSVILDRATCSLIRRRARFTPARDSDGNPTASRMQSKITWRIAD